MSEFELAEALDLPEDYSAASVLEKMHMSTTDELVAAHSELSGTVDYPRYYSRLISRVLDQAVTENLESRYRSMLTAEGYEPDPDEPLVFRGPKAQALKGLLGFQAPTMTTADDAGKEVLVSSDYVLIEGSHIWEGRDDSEGRWGGTYGTSELAHESIEAMGFVIDMLDEDFKNDNIGNYVYAQNVVELLARHEMPDEQLRGLLAHAKNLSPVELAYRLENADFRDYPNENALDSITDFGRVAVAYLLTDSEREHGIELSAFRTLEKLGRRGRRASDNDLWFGEALSQFEERVATARKQLEKMERPKLAFTNSAKARRNEYLKLQQEVVTAELFLTDSSNN